MKLGLTMEGRRDEAWPVKALTEKHLAIFRRHIVDVIGIPAEFSSDEIGNVNDRRPASKDHLLCREDDQRPLSSDKAG